MSCIICPRQLTKRKGERGRKWHDGVINAVPFYIEIRDSQMCEDWYHIGSCEGAVRAAARMRNGATELDAGRKACRQSVGTRTRAYMRLCDRIANMKACSELLHLHYPALDKLQIPSHCAPGLQYFHLPTKF